MSSDYRLYHPRWFRTRMPIFWWLRRLAYVKFITREMTSLAVGYAALLLMVQVRALSQGPEAYERFEAWLASPTALILNSLVLLFLVFHSVTWLNLAPQALVLRLGRWRVPNVAVLVGHYLAWIGFSAVVAWYLLGRS